MSCRISTHGTPGLVPVNGLAVAGALSAITAQYSPAVAQAVIAKRSVVRDMSPQFLNLICLGRNVS
ncbi:MAG: hypothetical protein ACM4D3_09225 [Candidatus Sericytochromatia bacterium]